MSPEKIPTRTRLALAQKMRFLRFTRGWSQEVLAELAGLHRTYISQIERGQVSAAPARPCARGISPSVDVTSAWIISKNSPTPSSSPSLSY